MITEFCSYDCCRLKEDLDFTTTHLFHSSLGNFSCRQVGTRVSEQTVEVQHDAFQFSLQNTVGFISRKYTKGLIADGSKCATELLHDIVL